MKDVFYKTYCKFNNIFSSEFTQKSIEEMYGGTPNCEPRLNEYIDYVQLGFLDAPESYEPEKMVEEKSATTPPAPLAPVLDDSIADEVPSMTLTITNVVSMANMRCHLRLKEISKTSVNVEYKALQNVSCCQAQLNIHVLQYSCVSCM